MTEWREALCPLCGLSHGMINITVEGKPWIKLDQESYWDKTKGFDPNKPFGVVKASEGRGTMRLVRYYGVEEDAEGYFPVIKERLLTVLREWIAKGWITAEEVKKLGV